jgi:hypothetical protein
MKLNLANGLFKGYNDKDGIMLCGYEWGFGKADQEYEKRVEKGEAPALDISKNNAVFSNKASFYGEQAKKWHYDRRIIKWFELWGHPLSEKEDAFEKTILQTNWCNSLDDHMKENPQDKLLVPEQVENFLYHVRTLQPRLILFFGSKMIEILQDSRVIKPFQEIVGRIVPIDGKPFVLRQKEFEGKRFKVGFQDFEKCKVVCLPHPSSSVGLANAYIVLFKDEIGSRIQEVKTLKHIK